MILYALFMLKNLNSPEYKFFWQKMELHEVHYANYLQSQTEKNIIINI